MLDAKAGTTKNIENLTTWMATAKVVTEKELRGILRWFVGLRLACPVQTAAAKICVEFLGRL